MWNKQNQYQTYLDLKFPVQICVRFVGCNIHNKWSKGEGGGFKRIYFSHQRAFKKKKTE